MFRLRSWLFGMVFRSRAIEKRDVDLTDLFIAFILCNYITRKGNYFSHRQLGASRLPTTCLKFSYHQKCIESIDHVQCWCFRSSEARLNRDVVPKSHNRPLPGRRMQHKQPRLHAYYTHITNRSNSISLGRGAFSATIR